MAEWLGRGLQNLLQRFESARDLKGYHPQNRRKAVFLFGAEAGASSLADAAVANKKPGGRSPAGLRMIPFVESPLTGSPEARSAGGNPLGTSLSVQDGVSSILYAFLFLENRADDLAFVDDIPVMVQAVEIGGGRPFL